MRRHAFFVVGLLLSGFLLSGLPVRAAEIGVLQYNVKGGHGGWTLENDTLQKQIDLIVRHVRRNKVDFIALQQAGLTAGDPGPAISDSLQKGWRTIVSVCNKDTTQLAYSADWELVKAADLQNPLLNGKSPQRGWVRNGCAGGDGRPYNIALFQQKYSSFRLLVVVLHFPHCLIENNGERDFAACLSNWEMEQFHQDLLTVIGRKGSSGINLLAIGDMNELAEAAPKVLEQIFPSWGALQLSTPLFTCCNKDRWKYRFDRILSNSSNAPMAEIIMDGAYPLNPYHKSSNVEHKAIYARVSF